MESEFTNYSQDVNTYPSTLSSCHGEELYLYVTDDTIWHTGEKIIERFGIETKHVFVGNRNRLRDVQHKREP